MNLGATQYNLSDRSLEIYISGCKDHPCAGCHNPLLWNEDEGEQLGQDKLNEIKKKVDDFNLLIKNIKVYGGEPLEKPVEDVVWLLTELKKTGKTLWLFTRFELDEVPRTILELLHFIKTGKYDASQLTEDNVQFGIKLASANQKVFKLEG